MPFDFGTGTAVKKAADFISEYIGKPVEDYAFGDLSAASVERLKTAFRRRGVLPRREASMEALLQSFSAPKKKGDFERMGEPIVFVSMRSIRNWYQT